MPEALQLYRVRVQPEWIDYNNHLVDAYYLVIFRRATDALIEQLGLAPRDAAPKSHMLSVRETHLSYLREIKVGVETRVDTQLLGHDESRLHLFHTLYAEDAAEPRATNEELLVNLDSRTKSETSFLPAVRREIESIERAQAGLPRPANAGRHIRLPR
jgi:acyl-CoA thioester hydrolase